MVEKPEPVVVPIKNGWHAGSVSLNITVRGATPEEARERFAQAVETAKELRANAPDWGRASAELG